jgi:cell division protein FtsA
MSNSELRDEVVVGLDIGTTKIVALIGKKNEFGKIEILGVGKTESAGVIRGVVTQIPETAESIKKAIEEAADKAGYDIVNVNVGIASQHIKSYQTRHSKVCNNEDELINKDDLQALIDDVHNLSTAPGESIITALPQEYFVDNMEINNKPIGVPGRKLEANFHIITGRIEEAKRYNLCTDRAGLVMENLFLEPLASAEAVLSPEEKEVGVALVDIGGGTTDVAIFHDGKLRHTAVVPLAGNSITDDIRNVFKIVRNYAELLKVKHGSAIPTPELNNKVVSIPKINGRQSNTEIELKTLAEIIKARVTQIIELVDLELYNSGFRDHLGAGIVITGGGAQLKHICQLAELITGLEARVGVPSQHIVAKENDPLKSPLYSTGVGLMILGFNSMENKKRTTDNKQQKKVKDENTRSISQFLQDIVNKGIGGLLDDKETKL